MVVRQLAQPLHYQKAAQLLSNELVIDSGVHVGKSLCMLETVERRKRKIISLNMKAMPVRNISQKSALRCLLSLCPK